MSCTTSTFVWIHDSGITRCAKHAFGNTKERFDEAETNRESIVWTASGSWMRVNADDARKVGFSCRACNS